MKYDNDRGTLRIRDNQPHIRQKILNPSNFIVAALEDPVLI